MQMKKARMNISHFRFILFNLKIFGEIVTTFVGWAPQSKIQAHIYARSWSHSGVAPFNQSKSNDRIAKSFGAGVRAPSKFVSFQHPDG